jgi:hypothetical protein
MAVVRKQKDTCGQELNVFRDASEIFEKIICRVREMKKKLCDTNFRYRYKRGKEIGQRGKTGAGGPP